ncbi:hypothetical protein [Rhizobium halophytocola]|uniref:Uncharacterized protein n=1 Tax=Rhizobium halophytocola TaxID=735519 RepID=A0ABS4DY56_9HYPH|nr:hypothetical protein [Rhizobium halophytocola]MBP1850629.1 hypothetical protein [Rhizobium halophytocola]
MTILIDTLGKAARHNMLVQAHCRKCGRQAKFLATDLVRFYSPGRRIETLPFKCRECDASDCRIVPIEFITDRTRETIVWRPTKVKQPG